MMRNYRFLLLSALLIALAAGSLAGPVSYIVVYGDSLSDNGNLYTVAGRPTSPPYYSGRFSNGPVAVEKLATNTGLPLIDNAWGGATTGIGNYGDGGNVTTLGAFNLPGMTAVFGASSAAVTPLAPSSLFIVWGGPNDFLAPAPGDSGTAIADRAVQDLLDIVAGIQSIGGQRILVPGMPDLGLTPSFAGSGNAAAGTLLTNYFNAQLQAGLPAGVMYYDTAALMRDIYNNPAAYGITNVTQPCLVTTPDVSVCNAPDAYLFWDDFHPTAKVHGIVAARFEQTALPEPSAAWLAATGAALIALRWRRLRSR